jgi:hypothetical protein
VATVLIVLTLVAILAHLYWARRAARAAN